MALALNIGKCTLLGNYRENNEDAIEAKQFPDMTVCIAADAKEHRFRNVLWKYLGNKEVGEGPEVKVVPIQPGDRFLLCSDGLSGVVPDPQLLSFIQENRDVQQCADGLGQLAIDQGSRD